MTPLEIRRLKRRNYATRRNELLRIKRAACIYRPRMTHAMVVEAVREIAETGISIRKYAAEINVHYSALAKRIKALNADSNKHDLNHARLVRRLEM